MHVIFLNLHYRDFPSVATCGDQVLPTSVSGGSRPTIKAYNNKTVTTIDQPEARRLSAGQPVQNLDFSPCCSMKSGIFAEESVGYIGIIMFQCIYNYVRIIRLQIHMLRAN